MKLKSLILSLAAATTVIAPIGVAAAATNRAIAPIEDASELSSGNQLLVGLLAAAGVIALIVIVSDDDEPASA